MVGRVRGAVDRQADSPGNSWDGHRAEVRCVDQVDQYRVNAMDVSRRTLIVGGSSAIVGASVGAGVTGFVTTDHKSPTLWQRGDRSGAPQIGRASCRERVEISVGAGALKKTG